MIAWLDSLYRSLTDWRPARRLLESLLRFRAHRPLSLLDAGTTAQDRLLRGLVHRASHTRFGKDHDFGRIRTAADFRRLVPVTTPNHLLERYWEPIFPWLDQATWPAIFRVLEDPLPECPYLPVSAQFLTCAAETWLVGLAQVLAAHPRRHLLRGRILGLVDAAREPLVAATWSRLPWTLQPYLHPRHLGQLKDDDLRTPTACLLGSDEQLTALIARVRQQAGRDHLTDLWPDLLGVLILRSPGADPPAEPLVEALGPGVVAVEIRASPLGIFAVENVRRGGLCLLADCGIHYELIDADDRLKAPPPRCGLAEAERGRSYELVVTTPSGLWACRTGVGVCFDGSEPARIRFVSLPRLPIPEAVPPSMPSQPSAKAPRSRQSPPPITTPAPMLRLPWSTPADR